MLRVFGQSIEREYRLRDLLARPEIGYDALTSLKDMEGRPVLSEPAVDPAVAHQVEINVKYAGYVERQRAEIERVAAQAHLALPESLDYAEVRGLSFEACQKLTQARPETLGAAARVPGVTPATISLLLVHLKRGAGRPRPVTALEHAG
jgi:tRNA uridine 5-carboxymethylaminomethyl modification enzyme